VKNGSFLARSSWMEIRLERPRPKPVL